MEEMLKNDLFPFIVSVFFYEWQKFYDALHFFRLANHAYGLLIIYCNNEIKNLFIGCN